jgi:GGDEF domain-containing protein
VIPEAGIEVARQLAHRISKRLAGDGDEPALSVSIGAAVCPQDGKSTEMLLRAADHDLYESKRCFGRTAISPHTAY